MGMSMYMMSKMTGVVITVSVEDVKLRRSGAYSPATTHDEVEQCEATVSSAMARQVREIDTKDVYTNTLVTFTMALALSDDDDEICAWSWRSSRMARLSNSKGGAMICNWISFNAWVLVDLELLDVGATEHVS